MNNKERGFKFYARSAAGTKALAEHGADRRVYRTMPSKCLQSMALHHVWDVGPEMAISLRHGVGQSPPSM